MKVLSVYKGYIKYHIRHIINTLIFFHKSPYLLKIYWNFPNYLQALTYLYIISKTWASWKNTFVFKFSEHFFSSSTCNMRLDFLKLLFIQPLTGSDTTIKYISFMERIILYKNGTARSFSPQIHLAQKDVW